jgi:hypothetical protein
MRKELRRHAREIIPLDMAKQRDCGIPPRTVRTEY